MHASPNSQHEALKTKGLRPGVELQRLANTLGQHEALKTKGLRQWMSSLILKKYQSARSPENKGIETDAEAIEQPKREVNTKP